MILAGGMSHAALPAHQASAQTARTGRRRADTGNVMRWLASCAIARSRSTCSTWPTPFARVRRRQARSTSNLEYLNERELTGEPGALKQNEAGFDRHLVVVRICLDRCRSRIAGAVFTGSAGRSDDRPSKLNASINIGVSSPHPDGALPDFRRAGTGTELSHLVNTGIYVFEPAIFARIPAGTFYDSANRLFPELPRRRAAVLRDGISRALLARRRHPRTVARRERRRARGR